MQGWEHVRHAERVDPFSLVKAEIDSVSERLRRGILSGIPVLERAAEYFFKVHRWLLWDNCTTAALPEHIVPVKTWRTPSCSLCLAVTISPWLPWLYGS